MSPAKGQANGKTAGKTIRVTQLRSTAGQLKSIIGSVRGLGLRRIRDTATVQDTPENRGMLRAAGHLLKIEEN
jgi:large subunit ribosomal protein L30